MEFQDRMWPRAVVFDLDGTLVDTAPDLAESLNQALSEHGLAAHPSETVRTMIGGGLSKLMERALAAHGVAVGEEMQKRFSERLHAIYAERPVKISQVYPGAQETLRRLQAEGIRLGLCTNKPHAITRTILDSLGLAAHFGCMLGSDNGFPKKPDPAAVRYVLAQLESEPAETVFVGDSITDVRTARAANLAGVVLVSHGYSPTPVNGLGADVVIDDFSELPGALSRLGAMQGI